MGNRAPPDQILHGRGTWGGVRESSKTWTCWRAWTRTTRTIARQDKLLLLLLLFLETAPRVCSCLGVFFSHYACLGSLATGREALGFYSAQMRK